MTPEQTAFLIGPTGLTVFLLYVVKRLWDTHDRSDIDVVRQRDEAIAGWREASAVIGRLADAIEARNRDDSERRRLEDSRARSAGA